MKTLLIAAATASVIALTAGSALAQPRPASQAEYEAQQREYERQRADYERSQQSYEAQRRTYEERRAKYLRDQAAYDRRYGRGAYERRYGAWQEQSYPTYSGDYERDQSDYQARQAQYEADRRAYEERRANYLRDQAAYDRRYGRGAYERRYGAWPEESYPSYSGDYGRDANYNDIYAPYRDSPCEQRRDTRTGVGALIGALAGAAIGSNVAATDVQTEGAVLGAVVGAGIGAGIGRASAKCDDTGYWYSRDQTISYREAGYQPGQRSGRYDSRYYARRGCRLAPAPAEYGGRVEYRYVRVCPDSRGRYRITD